MTHRESPTRIAKNPAKPRSRTARGIVILTTAALLLLVAMAPSWPRSLEDTVVRATSWILGHEQPTPEPFIVGIDDRALAEVGGWPWPRATFALLLDRLKSIDSGLILIDGRVAADMGYPDIRPSTRKDGGPIFTVGYELFLSLGDIPDDAKASASDRDLKEAEDRLAFPSTPADDAPLPVAVGIRLNRSGPADRFSVREGFSNLFPDADGIVRTQPLAARLRHRVHPAMALAAASQWRGFTPILAQDATGEPSGALIGEERIPTGSNALLTITYRGPAGTIGQVSAADVLSGRLAPESLGGHLILVGITADTLKGGHPTPMGTMSDMEIQATIIDNLLGHGGLSTFLDQRWVALAIGAFGILYAFSIARLGPTAQLLATTLLVVALLSGGGALIRFRQIQLPAAQCSAAVALLCGMSLLWHHRHIGRRKLLMRALWRGRLHTKSIDIAMRDPSLLLGPGRAVTVTALSVDIKGYGTLIDQMAPTQLAEFLKEYRRFVMSVVIEQDGFIEAWMGDECTAIFGTPCKNAHHAAAAVHAALIIRRGIVAARDTFERNFGVERFRVGIGIHTGIASAGDVASGSDVGFGVVGGAVEAARLLRAHNRIYRTSVLVGQATRAAVDKTFSFRPLDPLVLCGEEGPCVIHELSGEAGTILPQLASYMEGRTAYLKGDFSRAARLFGETLKAFPHDGPSQLFLHRSQILLQHPPQEKWTGVWGGR